MQCDRILRDLKNVHFDPDPAHTYTNSPTEWCESEFFLYEYSMEVAEDETILHYLCVLCCRRLA